MIPAVKIKEAKRTVPSRSLASDHLGSGFCVQSNKRGAKTRAPAASPSHHVRQIIEYWLHGANPPRTRLRTPKLAAMAVLSRPAYKANRRMSQVRSKARAPLAKRTARTAAKTASSVLPAAMPKEVRTVPNVVTLTRKAPRKMEGQKRTPKVKSVAMAIPVGGQNGVALG